MSSQLIWRLVLTAFASLLALPVLVVFFSVFSPQVSVWQHLLDTVLAEYVANTLLLASGVGLGAMLFGTSMAWVVSRYQFIGSSLVQWLLLLPLAMPAYIIAYTYTGMLDFAGPVQSSLRNATGWGYGDYWFPEIRSLSGAIIMMSLVLYPYVYMLARTAFLEQSASLNEVSRSLGANRLAYIFKVALPLARPAILAGTALAMMEAFADYGTVDYFGVSTFTTGIFRTWFGIGNQLAATQLAASLCSFVLLLLLVEKWSRRKIQYYQMGQSRQQMPKQVKGTKGLLLLLFCLFLPLFGFFLPSLQLLYWAGSRFQTQLDNSFMQLLWNSFYLAAIAALVATFLALLFCYGQRLLKGKWLAALVQTVSLGYALPGTVIAVGLLVPLSWFDHSLNALTKSWFDWAPGLVLSGSLFALLLAYCVRFLTVSLHNVETGLARIRPNMDEAARSLGYSAPKVLQKVHFPMLRLSLLTSVLLVFVDVLKELPATLILRPFNFNTLAVRAYELASDERLEDAALPAIAIVLVGIIPVIILMRALNNEPVSK